METTAHKTATGWTVAVSYGPSGGFYHFNTHGIRRICFGRLAVTFLPVEVDDLIEMAVRSVEIDKLIEMAVRP